MNKLVESGVLQDRMVVGIDYVGYEGTSIGNQIAGYRIFSQGGGRELGARVHAGESMESMHERADVIRWTDVLRPMVRLGHGIAFGVDLEFEGYPAHDELLHHADRLFCTIGVPIEACLSSNEVLEGRSLQDHPLGMFVERGWRFVLATDNPGIVRTTLRSEFERAIRAGLIRTPDHVECAIQNSIQSSFLAPTDKERILADLA